MDESRNGFLPKVFHEKRQYPFLLFYDTKVEMWFSPKDPHEGKVEIDHFHFSARSSWNGFCLFLVRRPFYRCIDNEGVELFFHNYLAVFVVTTEYSCTYRTVPRELEV